MPPSFRLIATLCLATAVTAGVARADDKGPAGLPPANIGSVSALNEMLLIFEKSPETIVAEVGTRTVTWGDIADKIRAMPHIAAGNPFDALVQSVLVELMQTRALAERAENHGLEKAPHLRRRLRNADDEVLADEMIRRSLAPNLSEKGLRSYYDALIANKPGPDEVQLRLIATETRDDAENAIARIRQGTSFTDVARQVSKDPTAANGGEIGFVRADLLSPEIAGAAFAMNIGEVNSFPIRIGNYWFVVQVESRRQGAAPEFLDVVLPLEQDVIKAGTLELRKQALQEAKIKFYGKAGKPAEKK